MNRILETVIANTITIGILITVCCITKIEVKRDYFVNGSTKASYAFKFF
jgi:hypothetical protein